MNKYDVEYNRVMRKMERGGSIDSYADSENLEKDIMLPDTQSRYANLKGVLNKQGFDIYATSMDSEIESYEVGGVVKTKKGVTMDAKDGGYFEGRPHSQGGIKAVNVDTNTPIEVEGGEVVITKDAVSDTTKRMFEGKMMTNKEILSRINQSGGGVALAKGGTIMADGGLTNGGEDNEKSIIPEFVDSLDNNDPLIAEERAKLNMIIELLERKIGYLKVQLSVISKSINTKKFTELTNELKDFTSLLAKYKLAQQYTYQKSVKMILTSLNLSGNAFNLIQGEVPNDPKRIEAPFDEAINTANFKIWFGDWEVARITKNDVGVSKAVNSLGMPEIYFNGSRQYKTFHKPIETISVYYWAQNYKYAEWFAQNSLAVQQPDSVILRAYVSCKNPIDLTIFGYRAVDMGDIVRYIMAFYPQTEIQKFIPKNFQELLRNQERFNVNVRAWQIIRQFNNWVKHVRDTTLFDGFMYEENNPAQIINGEEHHTKAFAIFNSNQIKFPHQFEFNTFLDDFRFDEGGILI
jgi:hypothetical protein